jgi:hypothetical protein
MDLGPEAAEGRSAINGPNLITQQRTASRLTSIPRWASNSSTARMLRVNRK